MSDFTAGFASRLDAAARALAHAYAEEPEGFAPRDLKARAGGRPQPPRGGEAGEAMFSPQPVGARFRVAPDDETEVEIPGTEGLAPGFNDPIAQARAAGYTEGYRHGHEQGALERARDQALMRELGETLKSAERVDRDLIAQRLRQTVLFLVSKMVGDLGVAPDLLARRIEAATDMLADSAEAAVLRVNPEDLPLLADILPETLHPIGDHAIERGGFVVESAATIVEEGPDLWLEQLAQAIDRVGVPPLC